MGFGPRGLAQVGRRNADTQQSAPKSVGNSMWQRGPELGPGGRQVAGFNVPSVRYQRVFLGRGEAEGREGARSPGPSCPPSRAHRSPVGTAGGGLSPARRPSDAPVLPPIASV